MTLLLVVFVSVIAGLALLTWLLVLVAGRLLGGSNVRLAQLLVVLLILQFILGMLSNLFVKIPTFEPWRVFHIFGPILLHTINATCLLILSIIFVVNAVKQRKFAGLARLGCAGVVVAYASGVTFVNAGQSDIYSFTMSLGFITAFTVYAYVAFKPSSRKQR